MISNGAIRRMGGVGLRLGSDSRVESATVSCNGDHGVVTGPNGLVQHRQVSENGGLGLLLGANSGFGGNLLYDNNAGGPQVGGGPS